MEPFFGIVRAAQYQVSQNLMVCYFVPSAKSRESAELMGLRNAVPQEVDLGQAKSESQIAVELR